MKKQRLITACLILFFLILAVSDSFAQDLDLWTTTDGSAENDEFAPGEFVVLNISLNNPAQVAGVAFTLEYDAQYLESPYQVTSSAFSFTYTDTGGTHSATTHRENMNADPAGGEINIIGANIGSDGGSPFAAGPLVIFTLAFQVKAGTPVDTVIVFSLRPTRLDNPVAGYNDETKPVLVGALGTGDAGFGGASLADDFPVVLGANWAGVSHSITVIPGKFLISGVVQYSGTKTGDLHVTAYLDAGFTMVAPEVTARVYTWTAGTTEMNYVLDAPNGTYYIMVYIDTDGSGDMHELEPQNDVGPIAIVDADFANPVDFVLSYFSLDIDGDGAAEPLYDGLLLVRYLLGYNVSRGDAWINNVVHPNGFRKTALEIETYIESNIGYFDIDGSGGRPQAYLDGFLVIRYLLDLHLSGPGWITGAYNPAGTRTTAPAIQQYLDFMIP